MTPGRRPAALSIAQDGARQSPGWRGVRLSVTNVPIGDVTTRPSSRKAVSAFRAVVSATP